MTHAPKLACLVAHHHGYRRERIYRTVDLHAFAPRSENSPNSTDSAITPSRASKWLSQAVMARGWSVGSMFHLGVRSISVHMASRVKCLGGCTCAGLLA
jgi:hypothetical protein